LGSVFGFFFSRESQKNADLFYNKLNERCHDGTKGDQV
jgi:hypothetical protein